MLQTLRPTLVQAFPLPPTLPEVLLLAQDTSQEGPKLLAISLWSKYKSSSTLGWVLWDNAFASVRQIPALFSDSLSRHRCALKYADFLSEVNSFLPGDFDDQVQGWLSGSGQSELKALPGEIWDLLVVVLEELIAKDVIRCTTVLNGVLCLAWQIACSSSPVSLIDVAAMLRATNRLTWRILSCSEEDDMNITPLRDFQHLLSERELVFLGQSWVSVVDSLPRLVKIENDMRFDDSLKHSLRELRLRFTRCEAFRRAVSNNLDLFQDVFLRGLLRDGTEPALRSQIAKAGKLIVNDFYDGSYS